MYILSIRRIIIMRIYRKSDFDNIEDVWESIKDIVEKDYDYEDNEEKERIFVKWFKESTPDVQKTFTDMAMKILFETADNNAQTDEFFEEFFAIKDLMKGNPEKYSAYLTDNSTGLGLIDFDLKNNKLKLRDGILKIYAEENEDKYRRILKEWEFEEEENYSL